MSEGEIDHEHEIPKKRQTNHLIWFFDRKLCIEI